MKNTFAIAIIIIVSLITSFSVKAQHGYRGFVDAQLGVVAIIKVKYPEEFPQFMVINWRSHF